jgi:peroxiredoxin
MTVLLAACSSHAAPAKELKELKIGDPAPTWSGIVGVDDKEHGLAEYKKAKIVVLVFTCNHCPWAKAWEDSLIAVQRDYGKKGVQVVAVNVNNLPADRLDKMKIRAAGEDRKDKKPFNFPYLYDSTQRIAYDYGAKFTPHVFVLDKDRKVAYVGAIDDRSSPVGEFEKEYLREALDALLAGKRPEVATSKARGCTIKFD